MLNTEDWAYGFYDYERPVMGTMFEHGVPPTGRGTPPAERGERLVRLMAAIRCSSRVARASCGRARPR